MLTVIAALAIGFFSNKAFAQAAAGSGTVLATVSGDSDYDGFGLLIRAAHVNDAISGAGPFTIFAPSNTAISNVPSDKLDTWMKDPAALATLVKDHIVTGKYDKAAILDAIKATGTATLTTLDNQKLTLSVEDKHLVITDAAGNKGKVIKFDMVGSNGVAIGLDAVLAK